MPRPLDTRLDRQEGRRTAGATEQVSAAIRRRHLWRAEAAMGAVIRSALARAGVDLALATRLCLADEAAASLAALRDTPELQRADDDGPAAAEAQGSARGDAFMPKILALAAGLCRRTAARFRQCLLCRTLRVVARAAAGIAPAARSI
jgi:hypothetical protein